MKKVTINIITRFFLYMSVHQATNNYLEVISKTINQLNWKENFVVYNSF